MLTQEWRCLIDSLGDKIGRADVLQVEGYMATLHGGDREQVVNKRTRTVCGPIDRAEKIEPGLLIPFDVPGQQASDRPLDVKQRSA